LLLEYKWVVLTVTTVGIFMATLDSSILVVGLPQVVVALNTNLVVGVWFITIYRLMITVLLVGIGRIADMYGRVRLYNLGFAIFTVGSLLSGLSLTAEELLAFRLVQGVGAALLFVNSVAIVTDAFAGEGLGKGIGINQVAINAGTITGYTLSGILIQLFTWRSIFLVKRSDRNLRNLLVTSEIEGDLSTDPGGKVRPTWGGYFLKLYHSTSTRPHYW